ncbi:hypothetical protein L914_13077, partial [Phytophthora nicotianae]
MAPSSAIWAISVAKSAPAVSLTTISSAPAPALAVSTSASSSATVESHQPPLVINPPHPVDPVRDRAIAAAASVDDLAAAVSNPASDPRDLAVEIGDLKARLTDARLAKLIAQRSAGEKQQKLTDLETRFRQSRAECSSLEQALAAETKQRITAEEQLTALSAKMMVHDEVVLRVQKALEAANEARASQSRKINHDWQLYKKNLRIYADRLERFH